MKIGSASPLPTSASFCCLKLHHVYERTTHGKDTESLIMGSGSHSGGQD